MGMGPRQVIARAELPLALPLVMTGIRTATVQVVATATLAALVGGGGLGTLINLGFGQQDYGLMIAGAILVAVLAVVRPCCRGVLGGHPRAAPAAVPGRRRAARRPASAAAGVPL